LSLIGELVIAAQVLQALFRRIDPRRSLIAGAIHLICLLAIAFSTAAAIWVGGIARENVLEQHVRRLSLETDQLSSDLSEAIAARVGALNTARILLGRSDRGDTMLDLGRAYEELGSAYPQLDWVAIADATGTVVRSNGSVRAGIRVDTRQWFTAGLKGPWVGVIEATRDEGQESALTAQSDVSALGDLSVPFRDNEGHIVGVIAAHLSWRRTPDHAQRLTDEADSPHLTEAYVLDASDVVLIGPASSRGKPWSGVPINGTQNAPSLSYPAVSTAYPVFERLTDGRHVLVSRAPLNTVREMAPLGLQVLLSEPNERVYQRANAVTKAILWASLSIGAIIALIGALGIRHLTRRLERLTLSVASVRRNDTATIEVPDGIDEVSQLGEAFSNLIGDLAQERSELKTLARELERRVAVRTLEVERLAEESRYAAVVRERLKLARALHDTLAHSMMAIISEIRFIRRLQTQDPASVADELGRAEQLAHEGLSEARSAIAQMRATTVRETGLGPALSGEIDKFVDRTGLVGEFRAEPAAARFGDERSEVLLRMTQEALRNIDRHAKATQVAVTLEIVSGTHLVLRIEDDGMGFDPQTPRQGHYGLIGLHEQAELIGADLRIDSKSQMGTKICISLPISPIVFASPDGAQARGREEVTLVTPKS
jgi:signal transduction histidine kinase